MSNKKIFQSLKFRYTIAGLLVSLVYYVLSKQMLPIFIILLPLTILLYIKEILSMKYLNNDKGNNIIIFNLLAYILIGLIIFILFQLFLPNLDFNFIYFVGVMLLGDIFS
ncbi:hypothetical protein JNO63_06310 [Anaerococcus sp. mt242]|uniref:hypothetical protein n=1 Tax=Anaerococcus sp. mt242 TaxID=2661917 RepID=UPI001931F8D1|nr:hypothetical protein [Anaerococcus sp. mt242]MBM0046701.1 hypothetical protein [Anaerococcus sp. mt242]MDU5230503.1 hypothetical protein [Anaerococcus sp.]